MGIAQANFSATLIAQAAVPMPAAARASACGPRRAGRQRAATAIMLAPANTKSGEGGFIAM